MPNTMTSDQAVDVVCSFDPDSMTILESNLRYLREAHRIVGGLPLAHIKGTTYQQWRRLDDWLGNGGRDIALTFANNKLRAIAFVVDTMHHTVAASLVPEVLAGRFSGVPAGWEEYDTNAVV